MKDYLLVTTGLMGCYKTQSLAHRAVNKAIKSGLLPHPKTQICVRCGKPAHGYDHRDYSKPLDVEAVCGACNSALGPAKGSPATERAISAAKRRRK